MRISGVLACCVLLMLGSAYGQETAGTEYSRKYAFSLMVEYSNDSSHIVLGGALNRKIGALGVQYERRLLHTKTMDFNYSAELRPVMIESDPTARLTVFQPPNAPQRFGPTQVGRCIAGSTGPDPELREDTVCGREQTFAEGLSPFGLQLNFLTRHRRQLIFSNHEGYIFSTRPIPVAEAGAFNFTFEFGVGVEWWPSPRRAVRVEYAVQHYSNKDSADQNPGVDSGFVKLTYSFGR